MNRFIRILTVAALLTFSLRAEEALKPKTLAGFGSSVCKGVGDKAQGGYITRLQTRMAQDGWAVTNVSRGGDTTVKIQNRWAPVLDENGAMKTNQTGPFLLPVKASYVLIGLSLANEKFLDEQFRRNLPGLIETCRTNGMNVTVANCYATGDISEENYAKVRQMNLFISQLDLPSINFLGSVDDGRGGWVPGIWNDPKHPNTQGHEEMFRAIVPSLWPALDQGKPRPERAAGNGMKLNKRSVEFVPADPVHAFAEVFWVKASVDGQIAFIEAEPVSAVDTEVPAKDKTRPDRKFIFSGQKAVASLSVKNGQLQYKGLAENPVSAELSKDWNMVVIAHWYARGETELYVNGVKAGSAQERYMPSRFTLGGAEFRDWLVYRSALNSDEIALLKGGGMYPSSLEVYATLNDSKTGDGLVNRAQSLSTITLK